MKKSNLKDDGFHSNEQHYPTNTSHTSKHNQLNNTRPRSRLEKVLDYNDTNIFNHQKRYQFLETPNNNENVYYQKNSKNHRLNNLNTTNLNVNLESAHLQNNKYKIEISPTRAQDSFETKYGNKISKYNNRYSHGSTKLEIETTNDVKVNKVHVQPLSSRSNNPNQHRMIEFQSNNKSKPGNMTNRSVPSIYKRSQSVTDNYKPTSTTHRSHRTTNNIHKNNSSKTFQSSSIFSLEKPSYTTKDSIMSDSISNLNFNKSIKNKRLSIFDSSGDLTEISLNGPNSNQKNFFIRTSTARDKTPRHNETMNTKKSSPPGLPYNIVKQDMNKVFEENRKNHQEAIIQNNKIIQNRLRMQTSINKQEAKFIEKSLLMESDSIKAMSSNELGNYIDDLIHQFRLKSNLVNNNLSRNSGKSKRPQQISNSPNFKFDMDDIVESIIISEGTCDNEFIQNNNTLTKINEESQSSNSSQGNERDNEEERQQSELDDSTTFINYTHSYELEDLGSNSSELSFSQANEEDEDDDESYYENRTKTNLDQSD